mmetsp:Transcript_7904/g.15321  ORF Transcript_7904/g.15321 Transcript_7904/m.15321 type:complete len:128 (+) Transcript_7904:8766-9149(+)
MVLGRGSNLLGPSNRDEKGAYEELDDRIKKYMVMEDDEWEALYLKMKIDRKYPGYDNLKLHMLPSFLTFGASAALTYDLYATKGFTARANIGKVLCIPIFLFFGIRHLDISFDILKHRNRYPEMYQV